MKQKCSNVLPLPLLLDWSAEYFMWTFVYFVFISAWPHSSPSPPRGHMNVWEEISTPRPLRSAARARAFLLAKAGQVKVILGGMSGKIGCKGTGKIDCSAPWCVDAGIFTLFPRETTVECRSVEHIPHTTVPLWNHINTHFFDDALFPLNWWKCWKVPGFAPLTMS